MDQPASDSNIPAAERIPSVDILRGFALFGILVVNITTFRSGSLAYQGIDRVVDWLILVLFQGKFLSLFAFLFGVSFALFTRKSTARSNLWRYAWRTVLLLLIGALHYIFIWEGDILMEYAVAGFLLLPFARQAGRTALRWGLGLYGFYAFFLLVVVVASSIRPQPQVASGSLPDPLAMPSALVQNGSYPQMVAWRAATLGSFLEEHLAAAFFLLGIFLIGVYAGRAGLIADPEANRSLLKKVVAWGLPLGLFCNVIYALAAPTQRSLPVVERAAVIVMIALAPIILGLAYAAGAALLSVRLRWISPLAAVGRMSLSHYLFQSAVMTLIFYPYGLGLFGQVGPSAGFLLAAAIFAVQVGISQLWFRRFRYGPVEWLWRSLTYGKWIKIGIERGRGAGIPPPVIS
jgi:uncharacterized protein